jgi:hypothetical protein
MFSAYFLKTNVRLRFRKAKGNKIWLSKSEFEQVGDRPWGQLSCFCTQNLLLKTRVAERECSQPNEGFRLALPWDLTPIQPPPPDRPGSYMLRTRSAPKRSTSNHPDRHFCADTQDLRLREHNKKRAVTCSGRPVLYYRNHRSGSTIAVERHYANIAPAIRPAAHSAWTMSARSSTVRKNLSNFRADGHYFQIPK